MVLLSQCFRLGSLTCFTLVKHYPDGARSPYLRGDRRCWVLRARPLQHLALPGLFARLRGGQGGLATPWPGQARGLPAGDQARAVGAGCPPVCAQPMFPLPSFVPSCAGVLPRPPLVLGPALTLVPFPPSPLAPRVPASRCSLFVVCLASRRHGLGGSSLELGPFPSSLLLSWLRSAPLRSIDPGCGPTKGTHLFVVSVTNLGSSLF